MRVMPESIRVRGGGRSLGVHLIGGLPTDGVQWGFERLGEVMPVVPLDALAGVCADRETRLGVLLPPFVEPSMLVESWEGCDFLPLRFGRPAHIASVTTVVDVDHVADHLASAVPLSQRGWGRSHLDRRTVADIVVGQIESATHLALVGGTPVCPSRGRSLGVLNPTATRVTLGCESGGLDLSAAPCARVAPPWLEALQAEGDAPPGPDLFVYRRTRPFDPERFGLWLRDPPRDLLRGKGNVWLANDPDQSFGYSCAGSVHRLFPSGRWWASRTDGAWPECASGRRRLLSRWHPRFGDRRQEIAFAGVDLEPDRLAAGLDACLVSEDAIHDVPPAPWAQGSGAPATPRTDLH